MSSAPSGGYCSLGASRREPPVTPDDGRQTIDFQFVVTASVVPACAANGERLKSRLRVERLSRATDRLCRLPAADRSHAIRRTTSVVPACAANGKRLKSPQRVERPRRRKPRAESRRVRGLYLSVDPLPHPLTPMNIRKPIRNPLRAIRCARGARRPSVVHARVPRH